jgi:5-methylcytosine-specific restriction endonuclease McrA
MTRRLVPLAVVAVVWAAAGRWPAAVTIPAVVAWWALRRRRRTHGRVPLSQRVRATIVARDDWRCYLCDQPIPHWERDCPLRGCPWDAQIDHVMPVAHGGTNRPSNLRAAHAYCNQRKGARL